MQNSLHHEGHEDHEVLSWNSMGSDAHPKGEFCFLSHLLFFFVGFVFFVVQQRNLG